MRCYSTCLYVRNLFVAGLGIAGVLKNIATTVSQKLLWGKQQVMQLSTGCHSLSTLSRQALRRSSPAATQRAPVSSAAVG